MRLVQFPQCGRKFLLSFADGQTKAQEKSWPPLKPVGTEFKSPDSQSCASSIGTTLTTEK